MFGALFYVEKNIISEMCISSDNQTWLLLTNMDDVLLQETDKIYI